MSMRETSTVVRFTIFDVLLVEFFLSLTFSEFE